MWQLLWGYCSSIPQLQQPPSALAASRPNGILDAAETGGLALCDDGDVPCVRATDRTGGDEVMDVTSNVIVGEPISVATGLWRVPYDVVDDAGNRADTVYRHVSINNDVQLLQYI